MIIMTKLFEKQYPRQRTSFYVGDVEVGKGFVWITGPCAVEGEEHIHSLVTAICENADILRGGVFKPRTSPYSFAGLGEPGLGYIVKAGQEKQRPVLVEFLEPQQVIRFAPQVDMIQIGARNMYNYPLLQTAALSGKPILLKRHFSATIDELLYAAEYILDRGNDKIALCERGIRSFEPRYRNCLDLTAVVMLKQITHLPVFVDPSHAAGDSSMVEKLALAAVCSGADGLLLEVHQNPITSLSDAAQAITPQQLARLRAAVEKLHAVLV